MTSALLAKAESAGLSLSVEDDELVIEGPQDAEAIAFALLAEKGRIVQAIRVVDLASRNWERSVIVGGRWADGGRWYDEDWRARNGAHRRTLLLGTVEGGSRERLGLAFATERQ